jgi:LmbE family N-acetylglucosaminyl deacetylase
MADSDARAPLTMLTVHAHPDDEASSTGGVLAKYSREGIRTVLVTCTNGELGDAAGGVKPGEDNHDEAAVVAQRRQELAQSCQVLGVSHLELLGYHDSGMMGWPQNEAPEAFWNIPVASAAGRLAGLFERYQPQVVVTYDANGFYGHPDHIQAHRITLAALELAPIPKKLYFPVIPQSEMEGFLELMRATGSEAPTNEELVDLGTPDEHVAARVDCSGVVEAKYRALEAHASQTDNQFFLGLGPELFERVFSVEFFVRARDTTGASVPEDDLFAGLRPS